MRSPHDQDDPCCPSSKEAQDGTTRETQLFPSGSLFIVPAICLLVIFLFIFFSLFFFVILTVSVVYLGVDDCLVQAEPQLGYQVEETRTKHALDGVRAPDPKRKASKEKVSILYLFFLMSYSCLLLI